MVLGAIPHIPLYTPLGGIMGMVVVVILLHHVVVCTTPLWVPTLYDMWYVISGY